MKKISRRPVVRGRGAASAAAILPVASTRPREASALAPDPYPSCTLTPEQTEGPYYFDTAFIRRDITEGRPGAPLLLKLKVVESGSCEPIADAVVDIWHCDAGGAYSGFETAQPGRGRRGPGRQDNEQTFLRGAQVTDADGEVSFRTVYPGWYPGRATHIHVKVYLDNDDVLTSQMYFPEAFNERLYASGVYAEHQGERVLNAQDGIFRRGGASPMLAVVDTDSGLVATLTLGVDRG